MTRHEPSQLIQDLLHAEQRGLLRDPVGRAVAQSLWHGIDDPFSRSHLERAIRNDELRRARLGPFDPPVGLDGGGVSLGVDETGQPVIIPAKLLGAHSITVTGSGGGKTTRIRHLARGLVPLLPGVWIFDLRKREYSGLADELAPFGLVQCPARSLRLNPLQVPPGAPPATWASSAARMLVGALCLPPRASKLVTSMILGLYQAGGVFDGNDSYPTLFDLREAVATDKSTNPQARSALLDSLDPVLLSVGAIFRYRRGWTPGDLEKRKIVFLLDAVGDAERDLILNTLLLGVFTSRLYDGMSNGPMTLWIAADEGQRLLAPSSGAGGIADLLGLVRGAGIGIDLSTQTADVIPSVFSNTAVKVIGRTGSATDSDAIAAAMGLSSSQRLALRHSLAPGQFVVQLGDGPWRKPFIVRVPPDAASRAAARTQAVPRLAASARNNGLNDLLALPVLEATEFRGWGQGASKISSTGGSDSGATISHDERRLLGAIVANPREPASRYPKLAGMSPSKAKGCRDALQSRGLVRATKVATGTRGRSSLIIEPTPAGLEILKEGP